MLIPDNIHPEQSLYYNGSLVLEVLLTRGEIDLLDLYSEIQKSREMTMPVLVLCLDWLYLLDIVSVTEQCKVTLCS
jgi:hypothetical protein